MEGNGDREGKRNGEKGEALTRFLTIPDLADLVGLAVPTIYNLRSRGEGPRAYKIGGQVRFRESDVLEWIEDHADQPRRTARGPDVSDNAQPRWEHTASPRERWTRWVLDQPRDLVPPGVKLLCLALATYWRADLSNDAFPSRQRLADELGVRRATVSEYIAGAVAAGLLTIKPRPGISSVFVPVLPPGSVSEPGSPDHPARFTDATRPGLRPPPDSVSGPQRF